MTNQTFETILSMIQGAPRAKRREYTFTVGRIEALYLERVEHPCGGSIMRDGYLMGYPVERVLRRQTLHFGPPILMLSAPLMEGA